MGPRPRVQVMRAGAGVSTPPADLAVWRISNAVIALRPHHQDRSRCARAADTIRFFYRSDAIQSEEVLLAKQ